MYLKIHARVILASILLTRRPKQPPLPLATVVPDITE